MLETKTMKYIILISAVITAIGAGLVGYYFGYESAKQTEIENAIASRLVNSLAIYKNLQRNDTGLAISNLKVCIEADVKTYDFYKTEVPDFGDKNEHLQEFIKQARAIQDQK